jgi:hypothetical protein
VKNKEVVPVEVKEVVPVESKEVKVVAPPSTKTKEPAVLGIEEVAPIPSPTPSPALIASPVSKGVEETIPIVEPEDEAESGVLWLLGLLIVGGVGVWFYKKRG